MRKLRHSPVIQPHSVGWDPMHAVSWLRIQVTERSLEIFADPRMQDHLLGSPYSLVPNQLPTCHVTVSPKTETFHPAGTGTLLKQEGKQLYNSFRKSQKLTRLTRPLLARVSNKSWEFPSDRRKINCKEDSDQLEEAEANWAARRGLEQSHLVRPLPPFELPASCAYSKFPSFE